MVMQKPIILTGGTIFTENQILKNSALIIQDGLITDILPKENLKNIPNAKSFDFPEDFSIIPGFIDMHIHGSNGKDIMDANFDAFATISQALAKQGTTSYLATTMTATKNEIENVLCHARDYIRQQSDIKGAEVLGVHLEGPFLSAKKVGAQREDLILDPDIQLLEQWQKISKNVIKLVTLAPELKNSLPFIKLLKEKNILASIGHTDANYHETLEAIQAGCTHVTHLFNAMRGIHQRDPGTVTAALLSDKVFAELIVDGVHLHPAIVEMVFKLKTADKLILVTDAMRAQCMPDGAYDLGGQSVQVKNNIATLEDSTLAGSTLKLVDAIPKMMNYSHCNLQDIIKMTSENPAKQLGLFQQRGSLAKNKSADIVILDKNHQIILTLCRGVVIH